jgi:hypothetical protein
MVDTETTNQGTVGETTETTDNNTAQGAEGNTSQGETTQQETVEEKIQKINALKKQQLDEKDAEIAKLNQQIEEAKKSMDTTQVKSVFGDYVAKDPVTQIKTPEQMTTEELKAHLKEEMKKGNDEFLTTSWSSKDILDGTTPINQKKT